MSWFSEFMKSAYTRHLEAEIVRVRMDRDSRIRELQADKIELNKKVAELEMCLIPQLRPRVARPANSTAELGPQIDNWKQALEEHNKALSEEEKWPENKHSTASPQNPNPRNPSPNQKKDLTMAEMTSLAARALSLKAGPGR